MGCCPSVCVLIAAHDAAATVARAVTSALQQPEATQVILVDDASGDHTIEAARSADDGTGRLQVHRMSRNGGPAAARNLGFSACDASWLSVLDADDYFLPGRLAKVLEHAHGCDMVADDLWREDSLAPELGRTRLIGSRVTFPATLEFATFVRGNIAQRNAPRHELGFLKPLMSTEFLKGAGLRYDERLRLGEDFILYARALAAGARIKLVEPCGYVAVDTAGSLSRGHGLPELEALARASLALTKLPLRPADRRAALAHLRHVEQKVHLRRVLQTRRAQGLPQALWELACSPSNAPYVLRQLSSDLLGRALRGR